MGMVLKKAAAGPRPASPLAAAVEMQLGVRIFGDPASVPPTILARAQGWSPPAPGGIHIIGHDTRKAGWRHGRLPGLRDMVGEFHPVFDRMMVVARYHEGTSVNAVRVAALQRPVNSADLWQAAIYRWQAWFGIACSLDDVYRDGDDRRANDPAYAQAAKVYDADHSPDELLRQTLDVRFIDWIILLDDLRANQPELFDAVWCRDAITVERLLDQGRYLPAMPFLRMRTDGPDRFRAVVAIFWEAERLFELLHAFGGRDRVTVTRLVRSLKATSMLGGEIAADTRTGRYAATSWCHRAVLATLFDAGCATGHDPRHPHRAWGFGGNPAIADELAGCVTDAARDAAVFDVRTAPPFAHDSRLRPVQGELPAHFFAGREVRLLAVQFLLEVRAWLGESRGRKPNQEKAAFDIDVDSAIGRLALLIVARICPDTAGAIVADVVAAAIANRRPLPPRPGPADFVANPRAWRRLHTGVPDKASVPFRSEQLGGDVLATMVREARNDLHRFICSDPATLGHTVAFVPMAWFEPHRETAMLIDAWRHAGDGHRTAFPGCYDYTLTPAEITFCGEVAARMQPSAIDPWHDPHCRKPDLRRRGVRGRPRKVTPPPPKVARAQQLAVARAQAARKGPRQ